MQSGLTALAAANEIDYPLGPMQSGILVEALLRADHAWNLEQIHGRVGESIELDAFSHAWTLIARRHPVLSSSFRWQGVETPQQYVEPLVCVPVEFVDLSRHDADSAKQRIAHFLREDRTRGFDLANPPLMRITVFKRQAERDEFIWTFHHILLDGRSFVPVLREVFATYDAVRSGLQPSLGAPPRPFAAFIDWLGARDVRPSLEYFRRLLRGKTSATPLPCAEPTSRPLTDEGFGELVCTIEPAVIAAARVTAQATNTTLGTLIYAAWALVLARFTHDADVVFGATRACRRSALDGAADEMVGLFMNTLPVRASLSSERSVTQLLQQLRTQTLELRQHEHTPLLEIQGQSELPRGQPLFETLVMFETQELNKTLRATGPEWAKRHFVLHEQPTVPLNLTVFDGEEFALRVLFDRRRFTELSVQRMSESFVIALGELSAFPTRTLGEIGVVSARELQRVVHEWNDTQRAFPENRLIHEGFEERVRIAPHARAVEMDGVGLSYAQLDVRANQLANHLVERGVGPHDFVGICVNRGLELVIALLAITKTGAAYVPLDPAYPRERLATMTRIAAPKLIVTQSEHEALFACPSISIDGRDALAISTSSEISPVRCSRATDACYAIFTSGSTGEPKGVVLTHRAVVNTFDWVSRSFAVGPGDRLLFVTSCCFDLSVYDVFGVLAAGATVVVANGAVLQQPEMLVREISERGITIWDSAPAALQRLVPFLPDAQSPTALRLVMLSGDWIALTLPGALSRSFPGVAIKSLGGATEAAIWSNWFDVGPIDPRWTSVPYGRPIQNARYYVLDHELRPVPIGVPGDLYIAGACLAQGYLNRPDLTQERFSNDPFVPGERMYKTGDLARYFESGDLEFLGRADFQIKVRGFRVELGEVELALAKIAGIKDAVCAAYTDGADQKALAAYVVLNEGATLSPQEIKLLLRESLPEFMLPSQVLVLAALPLSSSAKVDRKALPSPLDGTTQAEYQPPRTEVERTLVEIWQRVLKRSQISVTDNFFDLGGHSMLAVLLMSETKAVLRIDVPLSRILECPTIERLAASLEVAAQANAPAAALVTPLRRGPKRTFFLVHDGDGETLLYRSLAQRLVSVSVYGIQPRRLPQIPLAHSSVSEMASCYVEAMRRTQPKGPYYLGGLCAGGVIAFEMAAQLERAGERIELVVLLDAVEPSTPPKRFRDARRRLDGVLALWGRKRASKVSEHVVSSELVTQSRGPAAQASFLGRVLRTGGKVRNLLGYLFETGAHAVSVAVRVRVLRNVLERGARWPGKLTPLGARDIYLAARDRYTSHAARIPRVLLVKASSSSGAKNDEPVRAQFEDPLLGWGKYVLGIIEVFEAPGGHSSMLQEPHVDALARMLTSYLS